MYSGNKPESFQPEKNEPIFSILSILKLLVASQGSQARFGPCLDFGYQYALIRNNQSKKICGRILDLAWLKFTMAALNTGQFVSYKSII